MFILSQNVSMWTLSADLVQTEICQQFLPITFIWTDGALYHSTFHNVPGIVLLICLDSYVPSDNTAETLCNTFHRISIEYKLIVILTCDYQQTIFS